MSDILLSMPEDRICPRCGKTKPASAFRSPEASFCKACANRNCAKTVRLRRFREAIVQLANKQIVASVRGDRIDAPRISQICAKMIELFGGTNKFCKIWHDQMHQVIEERPGSALALQQLNTVAKLVKDSTASVDSSSEFSNMTEEELSEAYAQLREDIGAEIATSLAADPVLLESLDGDGADELTLGEDGDDLPN
jgi:hypothetical protein